MMLSLRTSKLCGTGSGKGLERRSASRLSSQSRILHQIRSLSDVDADSRISPPVAAALASVALLVSTAGDATAHEMMQIASSAEGDVAHTIETILRPLLTLYTFLYIIRIPMTWYPDIDGTKAPWSLVVAPTEWFLSPIRSTIGVGGVGGVDVSPIIAVSLVSFLNEILLGPQGILILIQLQASSGY
jgi:YggT family protein